MNDNKNVYLSFNKINILNRFFFIIFIAVIIILGIEGILYLRIIKNKNIIATDDKKSTINNKSYPISKNLIGKKLTGRILELTSDKIITIEFILNDENTAKQKLQFKLTKYIIGPKNELDLKIQDIEATVSARYLIKQLVGVEGIEFEFLTYDLFMIYY